MGGRRDPRSFFAKYHESYGTSQRHAHGRDLERLVAGLQPRIGERGLDVATGGGHTALFLLRLGIRMTVTDITPEMLDDACELARTQGFSVEGVTAYAESLPFSDQSFELVTCRRAAHHFQDLDAFLRQARRVLTPDGRIGISDMTASAREIGWLNQLERLRDPSHHGALTLDQWYEALLRAGFSHLRIGLYEEPMRFEEWLSPVTPDSSEGRAALAFFPEPDAPWEFVRTATFIKRRILIWAHRQAYAAVGNGGILKTKEDEWRGFVRRNGRDAGRWGPA